MSIYGSLTGTSWRPGGPGRQWESGTFPVDDAAVPTGQASAEMPVRAIERGSFTVAASLLLTTLAVGAVAAAPFVQSQWDNPVARAASQQAQQQNILLSTLTAPVVTPRGVVVSNPGRARQPQVTYSLNLLGTTLLDAPPPPDSSVVFRPPTYAALRAGRAQQPQQQANLLTGTLAQVGEVAAPFMPAAMEVPRGRAGILGQEWQNLLVSTLAQQASPFIPSDTGQRHVARWGQHETPQNWLALTFVQPPLVGPVLPQPIRLRWVQRDANSTSSGLALTQQSQAVPFRQQDFQSGVARKVTQYQQEANRLPIVSFVAPAPFAQYEWITPASVRYSPARHDVQVNLLALGIPEPGVAGSADEWIIRARRRGRR